MTSRPKPRSYRVPLAIGLTIGVAHLLWLFGQALFTDGRLADDWVETIPLLVIAGAPTLFGFIGIRSREALMAAACISFPMAFLSLSGALLPLIVPAVMYLLAWKTHPARHLERSAAG